jgi:octaprenyl-diphosphate synthase
MIYIERKIIFTIKKEINFFKKNFFIKIKNKNIFLKKIIFFLLKNKGKQIRPILIFFIAKILGNINYKTYKLACLIELIHTASIIHDDIIDNSSLRRNNFPIHKIWKNKIAVLIGDYFFSKGLLLIIEYKKKFFLKKIIKIINNMIKGEIFQIKNIKKKYKKIIFNKTANLISVSCEESVKTINNNKNHIFNMKIFGKNIGIAFQIKDDILDYEIFKFLKKKIILKKIKIINYFNEIIFFLYKKSLKIIYNYPDNYIKKSIILFVRFIFNKKL